MLMPHYFCIYEYDENEMKPLDGSTREQKRRRGPLPSHFPLILPAMSREIRGRYELLRTGHGAEH